MTSVPVPICAGCQHFNAVRWTCDAFPSGIPPAIVQSTADHRRPYPGDHGIRFAPIDEAAARYAAEAFAKES